MEIDRKIELWSMLSYLHPFQLQHSSIEMSSTAMNMDSILSAISAIESQVQSLRSAISSYEAKPTATKSKRASAKAAPASASAEADAPAKPKREINPKIAAMNIERKTIFEEMKAAWALANPSFTSLSKDELKKAIAEGKVSKPPSFPEAITEHSRRLRENDPAAEARHQTYLAKRAKKAADAPASSSAPAPAANAETSTVASSDSEGKKKRGPAKGTKLSDEQKAQRKAKRAENAAKKKLEGVPPLPPSPTSD